MPRQMTSRSETPNGHRGKLACHHHARLGLLSQQERHPGPIWPPWPRQLLRTPSKSTPAAARGGAAAVRRPPHPVARPRRIHDHRRRATGPARSVAERRRSQLCHTRGRPGDRVLPCVCSSNLAARPFCARAYQSFSVVMTHCCLPACGVCMTRWTGLSASSTSMPISISWTKTNARAASATRAGCAARWSWSMYHPPIASR
jgi:hypothetical protein